MDGLSCIPVLHSIGKSKDRRRDRDTAAGNSAALSLRRWNVEAGSADGT